MRVLLTGGTGLIGRRLCAALSAQHHAITVVSRQPPARVQQLCGAGLRVWPSLSAWMPSDTFDAVINLAGEPIADRRWSVARKAVLRDSRVGVTNALVARMLDANTSPSVLISGSAIGIYGDRGDAWCDETQSAGTDFAAGLCAEWEAATQPAERAGIRVAHLRTGLVLDPAGGLLAQLRLPFSLGMGARMGSGMQWMSWIHWQDYRDLLLRLLADPNAHGVYNGVAPAPVKNADFTRLLARELRRPAFAVAPALVLRAMLGERADLVLASQRVRPQRAMDDGFAFRFASLSVALSDLLGARH